VHLDEASVDDLEIVAPVPFRMAGEQRGKHGPLSPTGERSAVILAGNHQLARVVHSNGWQEKVERWFRRHAA
jgi:hypothetical protein